MLNKTAMGRPRRAGQQSSQRGKQQGAKCYRQKQRLVRAAGTKLPTAAAKPKAMQCTTVEVPIGGAAKAGAAAGQQQRDLDRGQHSNSSKRAKAGQVVAGVGPGNNRVAKHKS